MTPYDLSPEKIAEVTQRVKMFGRSVRRFSYCLCYIYQDDLTHHWQEVLCPIHTTFEEAYTWSLFQLKRAHREWEELIASLSDPTTEEKRGESPYRSGNNEENTSITPTQHT